MIYKAWIASVVLTIISIFLARRSYKKRSIQGLLQAGLIYIVALFFSYYFIFSILSKK